MSRFAPQESFDWPSDIEQARENSTDAAQVTSQLAGVALIGVGAVLLSAIAMWFLASSSIGRKLGGPKNFFTWVKVDTSAERFGSGSYAQQFHGPAYVTSPSFEMSEEIRRGLEARHAEFDAARRIGESYRMPPPRRP